MLTWSDLGYGWFQRFLLLLSLQLIWQLWTGNAKSCWLVSSFKHGVGIGGTDERKLIWKLFWTSSLLPVAILPMPLSSSASLPVSTGGFSLKIRSLSTSSFRNHLKLVLFEIYSSPPFPSRSVQSILSYPFPSVLKYGRPEFSWWTYSNLFGDKWMLTFSSWIGKNQKQVVWFTDHRRNWDALVQIFLKRKKAFE